MNIFDKIPGDRILEEQFAIISSDILAAINPEKKPTLEWFAQLKTREKKKQ